MTSSFSLQSTEILQLKCAREHADLYHKCVIHCSNIHLTEKYVCNEVFVCLKNVCRSEKRLCTAMLASLRKTVNS